MAVGGVGTLLVLLFLIALAVHVAALVDAARRSEEDLSPRGGKTVWVALLGVSLVIPGGFIVAIVYLLTIKPRATASRADLP